MVFDEKPQNEERYCSVEESLVESFKEVRQMRLGEKPKNSFEDFTREMREFVAEIENA